MAGGSYVQFSDKHALFDPMLPLEAAEHDSGCVGVLTESFTQEVWASVFRQLVDNWKDGTVGGQESVYVAATPGTRATPMRSAIKRSRDDVSLGDSLEVPGEDITNILRCIRHIKGELGIRPKTAAYHTVHGGLTNSHNKWAQVDIDLVGLPKQSDYDSLLTRTTIAESQSNAAIRELNELRLRGNLAGEVAGLKTQLVDAQEEMKEMAGQMDLLVKIVQGMANAQALQGRMALPPSGAEFDRQVASVNLTLGGFRQELKGGGMEFGGFKFESQDACRAWCLTHMPVNAYQCFSSMFYLLPLFNTTGWGSCSRGGHAERGVACLQDSTLAHAIYTHPIVQDGGPGYF
jgi:hypothetical protein